MKCSFGDAFRELSITILFDTTTLFLIPFFTYLMKITGKTAFNEHGLSPRFIGFFGFIGFIKLIELIGFFESVNTINSRDSMTQ